MRKNLWDYSRGIGIIIVVYGHVLRGLNSGGIVPSEHWITASDYVIYTFHMPLFFLLAGMNASKGLARNGFLKNKLMTVVYPYILWSFLQGLIQVAMSGSTNSPLYLSDLFSAILWRPLGQFWFLYALFLCNIFVYIIASSRMMIIIFSLFAYVLSIYFDWGILSKSLNFFIYYALGLLVTDHLKLFVERLANPVGIASVFIGLGISIYVAKQLGGYSDPWAMPAAAFGMLFVLQVSAVLARSNKAKSIEWLGLASMPIYLMHILAASGARIVLLKFGFTNMYLHLGVGISMGILFPLTIYYFIYLLKKEKFFGFARGAIVFAKTPLPIFSPENDRV